MRVAIGVCHKSFQPSRFRPYPEARHEKRETAIERSQAKYRVGGLLGRQACDHQCCVGPYKFRRTARNDVKLKFELPKVAIPRPFELT